MKKLVGVLAMAMLSSCSLFEHKPGVVVEKAPALVCEVPKVVTTLVAAPAKLTPGATNGDMKNRMNDLDAALEKANGRLADVQTVLAKPVKPDTRSLREKLQDRITKKEPTP